MYFSSHNSLYLSKSIRSREARLISPLFSFPSSRETFRSLAKIGWSLLCSSPPPFLRSACLNDFQFCCIETTVSFFYRLFVSSNSSHPLPLIISPFGKSSLPPSSLRVVSLNFVISYTRDDTAHDCKLLPGLSLKIYSSSVLS